MVDNSPISEELSDPRASLTVALRKALEAKSDLLATPYCIDLCKMVLAGKQLPDIITKFSLAGLFVSPAAVKRIKASILALPPELKVKIEEADPVIVEPDQGAIGVLKSTIASIGSRIQAIEQEIKDGKEKKTPVSEKRDDQLLKYYSMFAELRKQLEHERIKSEVVQAYKRAAADMCMISMGYIKDDGQKAKFLEDVRLFEQRNL